MTIGEKIKLLREDLKLSVEEFSKKLGIEASVLSSWEDNSVTPTEAEVQSVVDLVKELRSTSEPKSEETKEEVKEETPIETPVQETKVVDVTDKHGEQVGTCEMCGKEIHKYDKYNQFKRKKQDVYICDECDKKRREDPKFKRFARLVNWLTYSAYLYMAIALCTIIIYFAEGQKITALTIVTAVMGVIAVAQIVAAYIVSYKKNI